jgi:hypothetical protein
MKVSVIFYQQFFKKRKAVHVTEQHILGWYVLFSFTGWLVIGREQHNLPLHVTRIMCSCKGVNFEKCNRKVVWFHLFKNKTKQNKNHKKKA